MTDKQRTVADLTRPELRPVVAELCSSISDAAVQIAAVGQFDRQAAAPMALRAALGLYLEHFSTAELASFLRREAEGLDKYTPASARAS